MATNPILDIQIRKRESTNVPLPFEAMYQMLAEKQKRYDAIDAIEREQKSLISSFTSPIAGHSTYLEQKKQQYLQEAMKLHNSIPDKGSAEYKRKLDALTDNWNMDPNVALIKESSENWKQKIEAQKQLMLNDKYSPIMDVDANFQGVNPDGTLAKYNFFGMKPKPDYNKSMMLANQATPSEKRTVSYYKNNMMHTNVYTGKMPDKLESNLDAYLTPDDIKQIMFEKNLKTPDEYQKWKKAQAISMSDYAVSTENRPETSLAQLKLAQDNAAWGQKMDLLNYSQRQQELEMKKNEALQKQQGISQTLSPGSLTIPNPNYNPDVKNQISATGDVNSTGSFLWMGGSREKTLETNPQIARVRINADKVNQLLNMGKDGKPKPNAKNYRDFKQDLVKLREGALTNIDKFNFTSAKDAEEALKLIISQANKQDTKAWKFDDDNNPVPVVGNDWTKIWKELNSTKTETFAAMAGPLNSFNPYGSEAFDLNIGGERYILSVKPPNNLQGAIKQQNHEIAKNFNAGYAEFPNGYIDYKLNADGSISHSMIPGKVNVYFPDPNNPHDRLIESYDAKTKKYLVIRKTGKDLGY